MFQKITDSLFFKHIAELNDNQIFFVGGCVRDYLLKKECKDYDLIVRKIPIDELIKNLEYWGKVDVVGKSFGVIKFMPRELEWKLKEPLDIALPRTEYSTGEGHTDFVVTADENLELINDLRRRDFTINALLMDHEMNVIDFLSGLADLENKVIRMTSPNSFVEDPLRMIRALQFAARFGFTLSNDTFNSLARNCKLIDTVAKERIYDEFMKVINKNGDLNSFHVMLHQSGLYNNIFSPERWPYMVPYVTNKYDFWWAVSQTSDIPECGKRLKENLCCTNYEEELCNKMRKFDLLPTRENFLSVYNFDNDVLQSRILDFSDYLYIVTEGLPTTVKQLDIKGEDLMELGLSGVGLGLALKRLFDLVLNKQVANKKDDLLQLVK